MAKSKHMTSELPEASYETMKEVRKAEESFQAQSEAISSVTLDDTKKAPLKEVEPQTKISQKEARDYDAPYMKPIRSIGAREKPIEKFEAMRKRAWEYVKVIAENYECIGEPVEFWTKRFAGDNYDFWIIPTNKPVYVPRLVADQLSKCCYHKIVMSEDKPTGDGDAVAQYLGKIEIQEKVARISCKEVGSGFDFMKSVGL